MKDYKIKMINGDVFKVEGEGFLTIEGFLVIHDEFFEYIEAYNSSLVYSCILNNNPITNGE
jgi:hypothetical protein